MNADEKKWEAAAGRLIEAIPSPTAQQVMRETAQQLGIPLWMLITGLLQRAYDSGEHTAPVLDPACKTPEYKVCAVKMEKDHEAKAR